MSQPTWLTTKEAAALLRLKPCTLEKWRWLGEGHGPKFHKPGGRVFYAHADLISYINSVAVG